MSPLIYCTKNGELLQLPCPNCGIQYPAKEKRDGWGFEYKSKTIIMGLPLLHISFKYGPNKIPVPAKGIIAITLGQKGHTR